MIDTTEQITTCKVCGKPLAQKGGGHRKRSYCSDRCKMADSRQRRKEQPPSQSVTIVPIGNTQQIDRMKMEAQFMVLGEKLQYRALLLAGIMGGYGYWLDFVSRATDEKLLKAIAIAEAFQEERGAVAQSKEVQAAQKRIAELEQEVATLKVQLSKRTSTSGKVRTNLQRRLLDTGKVGSYPAVTIRITIGQGIDNWRAFAKEASEDMLARAIVAAGGS
jgi:endogenous inhibitor of DNA gyrase (YacG/DUF329 family)/cell division protein FtsB